MFDMLWGKPSSSDEGSSSDDVDQPSHALLRGLDTTADQLSLQAHFYAKQHPEFQQELAAVDEYLQGKPSSSPSSGQQQQQSGTLSSLLTADSLAQRFQSTLNVSKPGTGAVPNYKLVQLAQGTLQPLVAPDPALRAPVLNWVKEDEVQQKQQQDKLRRLQERRMQQPQQQQQQGEDTYDPDDDADYSDTGMYDHLHQSLASWQVMMQVGRRPLPKTAPRAWLIAGGKPPKRGRHVKPLSAHIPPSWADECVAYEPRRLSKHRQRVVDIEATSTPVTDLNQDVLNWRLPWVL